MRPLLPRTLPTRLTSPLRLPPPLHLLPPSTLHLHPPTSTRTLTTTPPRPKSQKHASKPSKPPSSSSTTTTPSSTPPTNPDDPFDFSDYEAAIQRTKDKLREDIAAVKSGVGGGGGAAEIEALRVVLSGSDKEGEGGKKEKGGGRGKKVRDRGEGEGEVVRVGDIASVVQRGRNVVVIVGEKEHIPPLLRTLTHPPPPSPLPPLNPQPTPSSPLTYTIPLPPPTAESRALVATTIKQKGQVALAALREARGVQRKRLRALEVGRKARGDDVRRALKVVDEMNGGGVRGMEEVVRLGGGG